MHSSLTSSGNAQRIADSLRCSTSYLPLSNRDHTGRILGSRYLTQPIGMWRRSALTLRRAGGILERRFPQFGGHRNGKRVNLEYNTF